jgi:hypothetical protein
MQADNPSIKPLAATGDEIRSIRLKPGCIHTAIVVPDGGKPIPIARIAPEHPILQKFMDGQPVHGSVNGQPFVLLLFHGS